MLKLKFRSYRVLSCVFCLLLMPAAGLRSQQPQSGSKAPATQIYVEPFSHLDLFWAGTRADTLARGNDIIATAIQIAQANPDFRFFIESDNFLANFVESHVGTQELAELKTLVKEGRIGIAPNWADIFITLPSGEVQARNLLYGKLYAQQVFGVNPHVIQPDDIPGFVSQYPQMLRESGTPYLLMSRMGPTDKSLFNWKSPDGSKVLVWSELYGYCWGARLDFPDILSPSRRQALAQQIENVRATAPGPIFMSSGCDLMKPTSALISNLHTLEKDLPSVHFVLANPQTFFDRVAKTPDLATLTGSIPMSWPHVVDGINQLWQYAVPATNALITTEEFSAINDALGYAPYPQADLDLLWKKLIESMDHNHDGQGGLIGDGRKREDSELVLMRGGEILRSRLRNIAERVKVPIAGSIPIVVFNGRGWQRDDVVKAHVTIYGGVSPGNIANFRAGMNLEDAAGNAVPFAIEKNAESMSEAPDIVFEAKGVPSLGYKTYYLTPVKRAQTFPAVSTVSLGNAKGPQHTLGSDVIENQFYRVTVDDASGEVTVFDKQLNRVVCNGMRIVGQEERGSNNIQPESNTGLTFPIAVHKTGLQENSAVRTVLKISGSVAGIPVVQRLILYRDLKRLDIENSVDWKWQAPFFRLEQLFPYDQKNAEVEYGVPFGANSMGNILPGAGPRSRDEIQPDIWRQYREIQGWVYAGTAQWGITVAADHQLVRLQPGVVIGNMLRGQRYTSARIYQNGKVSSMHYPPTGHYDFKYSLSSGTGDWKAQRSYELGGNFNNPLIPVEVLDTVSPKSLAPQYSFCRVNGNDLVISALKKSEANNSIILRLYEIQGEKAETPVYFLGKQQSFQPKNLLEQDLGSSNQQTLEIGPYQIKTLMLRP